MTGRRTSVVVPAFDEEAVLGACLESLARQTRPPLEVLVVDNNSRDGTARLARAHGARVVTETVQGIWPAAATGYDAARGDVVARCDADSVLPVDWVERIEDAFAADPGLRAVTGPGVFADLPPVRRRLAGVLYMHAYFVLVGLALGHPPLFGSNFAMRRDAWTAVRDEVHAGSDAVHDDIDLSFHIGRGTQVRFDPDLRVAISARPLGDVRGLRVRVVKGWRSVRIHSPHDGPWARYREKLLARTGRVGGDEPGGSPARGPRRETRPSRCRWRRRPRRRPHADQSAPDRRRRPTAGSTRRPPGILRDVTATPRKHDRPNVAG